MKGTPVKWKFVTFEGALPHLIGASLVKAIVADLEARDCKLKKIADCSDWSIDMPGMCRIDRPWEKFTFLGLDPVAIPSEDVLAFVEQLENLKERTSNGRRYYKLHAFRRCWVLRPSQHAKLLKMLRARGLKAEQTAAAFYADKKPASEVLREANAKAQGLPVEQIPDCGGHKNDRFVPNKRGAA